LSQQSLPWDFSLSLNLPVIVGAQSNECVNRLGLRISLQQRRRTALTLP
jgi:hypothetical protein